MMALSSDGKVYSWGTKSNGNLGLGGSTSSRTQLRPAPLAGAIAGKTVVYMGVNNTHVVLLTDESRTLELGPQRHLRLLGDAGDLCGKIRKFPPVDTVVRIRHMARLGRLTRSLPRMYGERERICEYETTSYPSTAYLALLSKKAL